MQRSMPNPMPSEMHSSRRAALSSTSAEPRLPLALRVITIVILASAIWLLVLSMDSALFHGKVTVGTRLLNAVTVFALAVALVLAMTRFVDRRPFESLGLSFTTMAWRPLIVGALMFLLPSAAGLALARLVGAATVQLTEPVWYVLSSVALTCVTVLIYEAIPEELIFRGYLFRNLAERLGPWPGAILQALLFAGFGTALWVHTSGWGVLVERGLIFLGMGIVLGCLRVMSGSVWTCVGFHLSFQLMAQTILGANFSAHGPVDAFAVFPPFVLATTICAFAFRGADRTCPTPQP